MLLSLRAVRAINVFKVSIDNEIRCNIIYLTGIEIQVDILLVKTMHFKAVIKS